LLSSKTWPVLQLYLTHFPCAGDERTDERFDVKGERVTIQKKELQTEGGNAFGYLRTSSNITSNFCSIVPVTGKSDERTTMEDSANFT